MSQISDSIMKFNSIPIPKYIFYESCTGNGDLIRNWIMNRNNAAIRNALLEPQSDIPDELN